MKETRKREAVQNTEDSVIIIERTPDFLLSAQQLSAFIHNLPLELPANDRLIALVVEQVQQAEKGAFSYGFRLGVECGRHGLNSNVHQNVTDKTTVC